MIEIKKLKLRQRDWIAIAEDGGEMARRAAQRELREIANAVRQIHANLKRLGYPAVRGLVAPPSNVDENIAEVRAAAGDVPDILECFWQVVGGIELVQLPGYGHVEFWKRRGLSWNPGTCDGVWIQPCDDDTRSYLVSEVDERSDDLEPGESFLLELSPDHYHKDEISGGMPYGVDAAEGWLAPLRWFEWTGLLPPQSAPVGVPDLLSYLRSAVFECAGFPGYYGHEKFEPIRLQLLEGVELS